MDNEIKDTDCPICKDDIKDEFTLKCKHTYCRKCILSWLYTNHSCPICRNNVKEGPSCETCNEPLVNNVIVGFCGHARHNYCQAVNKPCEDEECGYKRQPDKEYKWMDIKGYDLKRFLPNNLDLS
jgi:hypothetical protein